METAIGAYDPDSRTVAVTFTIGEIVHERTVNACLDEAGDYDAEATGDRVAAVARGVAVKVGLGVIRKIEDEPAPIAGPDASEEIPAAE